MVRDEKEGRLGGRDGRYGGVVDEGATPINTDCAEIDNGSGRGTTF